MLIVRVQILLIARQSSSAAQIDRSKVKEPLKPNLVTVSKIKNSLSIGEKKSTPYFYVFEFQLVVPTRQILCKTS